MYQFSARPCTSCGSNPGPQYSNPTSQWYMGMGQNPFGSYAAAPPPIDPPHFQYGGYASQFMNPYGNPYGGFQQQFQSPPLGHSTLFSPGSMNPYGNSFGGFQQQFQSPSLGQSTIFYNGSYPPPPWGTLGLSIGEG
ncbi:hypothetical protein LC085_01110 [Bacillus tianshenii]|uniref:hypothetical protein n=1 Tax=Sutcliffiella tianshenii TaxID=1463404 RepID=UPI001CD2D3A3|nr:hypothetical protein [Bacillus tianshenii]MCA1318491.1 hypothetical protein [Bacillus tianshenii]